MNIAIKPTSSIVLRDGKPFGDPGIHSGGYMKWPMPQTVTGMVRTAIGLAKDKSFFQDPSNIEKIKNISVGPSLMAEQHSETGIVPLFPVPADLAITDAADSTVHVETATVTSLQSGEHMDTPFKTPCVASWNTQAKTSLQKPFRLSQECFAQYRKGELNGNFSPEALGCEAPLMQDVQHNAISSQTGKSDDGRLYRARNLYFSAPNGKSLLLVTTISGDNISLPQYAYLGGERRTVEITPTKTVLPPCPDDFAAGAFLKLMLLTPGDFGGCCPDWLEPSRTGSWVTTPKGKIEIRLRHVWMRGWEPVSGWDYEKRKAKPMRKLVPEGSVYLVEVKDPNQLPALASEYWFAPLQEGQSAKDGFGYAICAAVGNKIKLNG